MRPCTEKEAYLHVLTAIVTLIIIDEGRTATARLTMIERERSDIDAETVENERENNPRELALLFSLFVENSCL